jgi:quercetin dioxygenase-like cupin family protein
LGAISITISAAWLGIPILKLRKILIKLNINKKERNNMFKPSATQILAGIILSLSLGALPALADVPQTQATSITAQIEYSSEKPTKKVVFATEQYELILFAFEKGQAMKEHTVNFPAYIQVIEGEAILLIDSKPITIKAGEGYSLPASVGHALKAPSNFKMLLLKQVGKL